MNQGSRPEPVIAMKTLGTNGRFANQLFQYAFLRFYAKRYGMRVETPTWDGQRLFGHADPSPSKDLPTLKISCKEHWAALCAVQPPVNVDLWGYFQETEYYSADKDFFRSLFVPIREAELLGDWTKTRGRKLIGLHLRYGDYGYGYFYETPLAWVRKVLSREWQRLERPLLYIATDDPRVIQSSGIITR